jgi:hypothetical protein
MRMVSSLSRGFFIPVFRPPCEAFFIAAAVIVCGAPRSPFLISRRAIFVRLRARSRALLSQARVPRTHVSQAQRFMLNRCR